VPYFIYVLKLKSPFDKKTNWTDETNATLQEHWNYLVDLHQKGVMKVVGRTDVNIESEAILALQFLPLKMKLPPGRLWKVTHALKMA